jgi:hypothetical protein
VNPVSAAARFSILLVCRPSDEAELRACLADGEGFVVTVGDGSDRTLVLFERSWPDVVVMTATLGAGDAPALVGAMRVAAHGRPFHVVVIGDEFGPVSSPEDAADFSPDRFVPRHLVREALLQVVGSCLALARRARETIPIRPGTRPDLFADAPTEIPEASPAYATSASKTYVPLQATQVLPPEPTQVLPPEPTQVLPPEPRTPGVVPPRSDEVAVAAGGDESALARGDFARSLRRKMFEMAERLFHGPAANAPSLVDLEPSHDHRAEIDLSAFPDVPAAGGVTEIADAVPERQLAAAGIAIMRGHDDAATVLAKAYAQAFHGRIVFRREGEEKQIHFDQGRPVLATSNQPGDRMGYLLLREGKITPAQYDECQTAVVNSGRRMGEVLVDLGYLKRRELFPAVRRHVEDIIYSLFAWTEGQCEWLENAEVNAEKIRLSRHPAAMIIEGIRRKFTPEELRVLIRGSVVLELSNREHLQSILSSLDLTGEEQQAIAAMDGAHDLGEVAAAAGCSVSNLRQLAWGLIVLGLAQDCQTEDASDDMVVGEVDLAIDRERIRARLRILDDGDYFVVLGVRPDATAFEIRRMYETARRDFASDMFPPEVRREFEQDLVLIASILDEAYVVLSDDHLRIQYAANLAE